MIQEFRSMIRAGGVSSLFRGVWPTLMRDVPFSAIYWVSIESMRDFWRQYRERHNSTPSQPSTWQQAGQALVNGSVSGTIAACFTTPLDVLKTRSQVDTTTETKPVAKVSTVETAAVCDHGGALAYRSAGPPLNGPNSTGAPAAESTLQAARTILQEEGIQGFWRGNVARMMKVAPACAIMISSYEIGKRVLE